MDNNKPLNSRSEKGPSLLYNLIIIYTITICTTTILKINYYGDGVKNKDKNNNSYICEFQLFSLM